ncbi:MAG: UPF0175 family protein [Candidatus Helarchaeota archaeon]
MGQTVTSRLPDDMVKDIAEIAKIESLDKSSVVRRLLNNAIAIWKLEYSLELYRKGQISLGKAAELSKLSIWEFLEKLSERKIPLNYSLEDLQNDLETVKHL